MSWKAGDIALIAKALYNPQFVGLECELINCFQDPEEGRCWEVLIPGIPAPRGCKYWNTPEAWLRKRRPPEQPSAFSYDEIISMCNEDIRPTEIQVREGVKHG